MNVRIPLRLALAGPLSHRRPKTASRTAVSSRRYTMFTVERSNARRRRRSGRNLSAVTCGLTISESLGEPRGVRLSALGTPSPLGDGRGWPPVEPKIRNEAERHALG